MIHQCQSVQVKHMQCAEWQEPSIYFQCGVSDSTSLCVDQYFITVVSSSERLFPLKLKGRVREQVAGGFPWRSVTPQNDALSIIMGWYQRLKLLFTCREEQWSTVTCSPPLGCWEVNSIGRHWGCGDFTTVPLYYLTQDKQILRLRFLKK